MFFLAVLATWTSLFLLVSLCFSFFRSRSVFALLLSSLIFLFPDALAPTPASISMSFSVFLSMRIFYVGGLVSPVGKPVDHITKFIAVDFISFGIEFFKFFPLVIF